MELGVVQVDTELGAEQGQTGLEVTQGDALSCLGRGAEVAGSKRHIKAPDDACQDMGKSSNARIAREKLPAETPEGQEVAELIGDQVTGLDRHVEAPDDGRWM